MYICSAFQFEIEKLNMFKPISRCCKGPFCFRHPTEILQYSVVPHKHGNSSNYNKICPFGVIRLDRYDSIQ